MKLYPTPPSIQTLVTLVPQSKLAFGHFPHRLAVGPPVLGQTESYSVQPCLPLAATIGPVGRSRVFLIETHHPCLIVWPLATTPSCPTATVWTTTFSKGPYLLGVLNIFEEGGSPPTMGCLPMLTETANFLTDARIGDLSTVNAAALMRPPSL